MLVRIPSVPPLFCFYAIMAVTLFTSVITTVGDIKLKENVSIQEQEIPLHNFFQTYCPPAIDSATLLINTHTH